METPMSMVNVPIVVKDKLYKYTVRDYGTHLKFILSENNKNIGYTDLPLTIEFTENIVKYLVKSMVL